MLPTIEWAENKIIMIDQRKLPLEEIYLEFTDYKDVADAIKKMVIRGAPAIGVAASFGIALGFLKIKKPKNFEQEFYKICKIFEETRPTARNLFWAVERMKNVFKKNKNLPIDLLKKRIINEAILIEREDIQINRKIGENGKFLIKDGDVVLTHCNAGELATAGYGTALGIIRSAFKEGKKIKVYVDETRPFLQGARLSCWELSKEGIPHILISDNMAGWMMKQGKISCVIVGADRVASNGDTANKIGTYSLSVLAKENQVPFYVACPLSTIDLSIQSGEEIPIEERSKEEVLKINSKWIAPINTQVENPAFDITPASNITAIITEKGIAKTPYAITLKKLKA